MVVALIALFVSLGGVSYGVATGSIDSREIKNGTIRNKDAKKNTFTGSRIKESTLRRVRRAKRADKLGDRTAEQLLTRGFVGVRTGDVGFTGGYTPMASLALPAGTYVVIAKASLGNSAANALTSACRLRAGSDRDETRTRLDAPNTGGNRGSTTLLVPHITSSAFTAFFECRQEGSPGLNLVNRQPFTTASNIKIVAIRTDSMDSKPQ
jgi:hypothetical protein